MHSTQTKTFLLDVTNDLTALNVSFVSSKLSDAYLNQVERIQYVPAGVLTCFMWRVRDCCVCMICPVHFCIYF